MPPARRLCDTGRMATGSPGILRLTLLLALTAGAVDAMVLVGFQILTAAQTGNTVLLAAALARGEGATGLNAALSVAAFFAGAFTGGRLLGNHGWGARRVLVLEVAVIAAAMALWLLRGTDPGPAAEVIGAVALAMGLQSAVMLQLRAASTTYVTGVLAVLARDLATLPDSGTDAPPSPWRHAGVWTVYFAAAVLGAALFLHWGPAGLLFPLAFLTIAALLAPGRPNLTPNLPPPMSDPTVHDGPMKSPRQGAVTHE